MRERERERERERDRERGREGERDITPPPGTRAPAYDIYSISAY